MSWNYGLGNVAFPDVCLDCKPPKRHMNCHADCKDYLDAKAEHEVKAEAALKAKQAERDAIGATYRLKRN